MTTSDRTEPGAFDRALIIAELHVFEALAERGGLTLAGLTMAHEAIKRTMATPVSRNVAIIRERVLQTIVNALVATTGMPASYWHDKLIVDVPDDLGDLGDGA